MSAGRNERGHDECGGKPAVQHGCEDTVPRTGLSRKLDPRGYRILYGRPMAGSTGRLHEAAAALLALTTVACIHLEAKPEHMVPMHLGIDHRHAASVAVEVYAPATTGMEGTWIFADDLKAALVEAITKTHLFSSVSRERGSADYLLEVYYEAKAIGAEEVRESRAPGLSAFNRMPARVSGQWILRNLGTGQVLVNERVVGADEGGRGGFGQREAVEAAAREFIGKGLMLVSSREAQGEEDPR